MMKKLLLFLLLVASPAFAQFTTVDTDKVRLRCTTLATPVAGKSIIACNSADNSFNILAPSPTGTIITLVPDTLANLGSPANNSIAICSNCVQHTNPCQTGGSGSVLAVRSGGAWVCDGFQDFSYSGSLNITGARAYSSNTSFAAHDRLMDCTGGSGAAISYTLPAATGSNLILDVFKVDSGTAACTIVRTSTDHINTSTGTTRTLSNQADGDTCRDYAAGKWICRGSGATSP